MPFGNECCEIRQTANEHLILNILLADGIQYEDVEISVFKYMLKKQKLIFV